MIITLHILYMRTNYYLRHLANIIDIQWSMPVVGGGQGCQLSRIWHDSHAFDLLLTHSRN